MKTFVAAATLALSSLAVSGILGSSKAHAFVDFVERDFPGLKRNVVTYQCTYVSHGEIIAVIESAGSADCPSLVVPSTGQQDINSKGKDGIEDCTVYVTRTLKRY